jgi:mono/diheme cytochrome c family protein
MPRSISLVLTLLLFTAPPVLAPLQAAEAVADKFFQQHCVECHDSQTKEAGLDLSAVQLDLNTAESFARWVKIHDRIQSGEMPPKDRPRPEAPEAAELLQSLRQSLVAAEAKPPHAHGTQLRRLTRGEYENTIRDLFDLPGIALQGDLPADGTAHGFDTNSDALDISHVNMAKYVAAADKALEMAIATRPRPPKVQKQRISLATPAGFVAHVLTNGDGVLLKNKQPDPDFPPAGEQNHIDQGAHERMGSFNNGASVGLFRHEDESFHPYFNEFVALYPGRYRMRISLWSFQWDKGKVLPARGTEAARLSIVQYSGDGRGGGHPSYVLGYFDAPPQQELEHEVVHWMNYKETVGFNAASLAPTANYSRPGRAMAFTGPGIVCDWFDIEGPLHDVWPALGHQQLFGQLPIEEFKSEEHPGVRPPQRRELKREVGSGKNELDPVPGTWSVKSEQPLVDADRLLTQFLPKAFRRPVSDELRQVYVSLVEQRLQAGDCFELAMRSAYRAALCSPDFLYHVEASRPPAPDAVVTEGQRSVIDDHALACRLSYFLWRSLPDETLTNLAREGKLREPEVLRGEIERMLGDVRSKRLIEDFLGQWLKLRQIAANDPDRKLYPEFSAYLQDSMVAETQAYFRELLDKDLDASHLVRSEFAMLNEKLAVHYGIEGVQGSQIRRVELPVGHPRGSFLTQASVLKVTANGTTTSPVPRGAFVMARLLGDEPEPPPANVAAIEPDVRGAQTIRDQLAKHRNQTVCASCHAKMDPPGFALEAFDVIGGFRDRYRSIGEGDPAPRGSIDPFIGIGFKLGPKVDASGVLPDSREFADVIEFQKLLAADRDRLLTNLAEQLSVYSTGRATSFSDRDQIASIVHETNEHGGGIRTLISQLVQSKLFQEK